MATVIRTSGGRAHGLSAVTVWHFKAW
jgi:hypothetical protein